MPSSLAASLRALARPTALSIALVAVLHAAIGGVALHMLLRSHSLPPSQALAAAAPIAPPVAAKSAPPSSAPPSLAATATPAATAPAGHATILDPVLQARESTGLAQLRAAGVNLETLLHHAAPKPRAGDEGGPLVPLDRIRDAALDPGRLERLERLIARMPFAAPLHHIDLSSPFGIRRDPFDGERAFHPGIDLEADLGAAVYSTAPGVVAFAGWDGAYGRMIEIDHGNGIRTRYGHLSRILVRTGERVAAHQRIGLVGSTGRSTGPHLHYEVRIDGRPLNPAKFLAAGRRYAPIAANVAE